MSEQYQVLALIIKIKALLGSMGKAEQRVAEYIIDNPEKVIYLTVSELAEKSRVSDATVVRVCQKIGNGNYQDLKVSLAQDIVTPLQAINEEITLDDTVEDIMAKVFNSEHQALRYTEETMNPKEMERAANTLFEAGKIQVMGLGNSHAIAQDIEHKFLRLGLNVTCYSDSHMQLIASSFLTENDVLFAVSYSGSSIDVIRTAKQAGENGAKVISMTNIGHSPLYNLADIRLCTASPESRYRILAMSSRIAQITLVDTLYTLIALKKPNVIEGFHKLEKALGATKY